MPMHAAARMDFEHVTLSGRSQSQGPQRTRVRGRDTPGGGEPAETESSQRLPGAGGGDVREVTKTS